MASIGEKAPDVTFVGESGAPVKLSDYVGKKTVVLYFYPKDETSGCTAQACSFRDAYEDFKQAGAEVIGVSADDAASHASFKTHHRLPFVLLSDPGGVAAKALGVKKTFGLIAGRVTFVIDRDGVVRHRFDSQIRVKEHVEQALGLVKQLETRPAA
ncbi:MAG: peroxiredoxin [Myxococcaceae bacterium]